MRKNLGEIVRAISALVFSCVACVSSAGTMDTGGQLAVSASGAAVYSLPIQVPPGTVGMEPRLSLNYSSGGGNGLLGMGWSLNGMSAVTRCPRTIAQDGVRGGIKFDSNDRFCLDGQRLILIGGTYGADGAEYRTEQDRFTKVISYGASGVGPAWFKVWTKSGQILEYGNSGDSKIIALPNASARIWAINKVSDAKTNFLTYSYELEGTDGDYHPTYIYYTGNTTAGAGAMASVKFNYAARPDVILQYLAGSKIERTQRLTSVETRVDQGGGAGIVSVKEYRFTYTNACNGSSCAGSGRSRLATISECALPANDCKPAISLGWNDGGTAAFQEPPTTVTSQLVSQFTDLNVDGRPDLVEFAADGVYVTLATPAGWGARTKWSNQIIDDQSDAPYFLEDVNGDGIPDIVNFDAGVQVSLGTGSDFLDPVNWISGTGTNFSATTGWFSQTVHPRLLVDVNGDGRPDLIGFKLYGTYVALNTGSGFQTATFFGEFGPNSSIDYLSNDTTPRFVQDVNGDGLADIVGFANDGVYLSLNTGSGFAPGFRVFEEFGVAQGWNNTDLAPRFLADVNGDGLPDIVGMPPGTGYYEPTGVYVALNTGTGFAQPSLWSSEFGPSQGYLYISTPRKMIDINGDGRADIVGVLGAGVQVSLSTGTGFTAPTFWNSTVGYETLIDIDGDGVLDLLGTFAGGTMATKRSLGMGIDLLTSVGNGLGSTTSVAYQPMTNASVYTKSSGAVFPVADLISSGLVVSSLHSPNGVSSITTNYQYGGARSSAEGRNLGLAWQQSTNATSGLVVRTDFRQDWPYVGIPSQVKVTHPSAAGPNNQLSLVTSSYGCMNPANGASCTVAVGNRYLPYANQTIERAWDLAGAAMPAVTTNRTIDNYGNATTINTSTDDGFSKTVTNSYVNDTTNWFIGQLASTQVSATGPDPSAALPAVTLTSVSPDTIPLGTSPTITLTGSNFSSGATVTIGGAAASNCSLTGTTVINCQAPPSSAAIVTSLVVYTAGGSASKPFSYQAAPTLSSLSQNVVGPLAGGTPVTLNGSNFSGSPAVTLGGVTMGCTVASANVLNCTTPPGTAGLKSVVVTQPGGSATLANAFTYQIGLTNVSPASGTVAGGTVITLTGSGFAGVTSATVGGVAATNCSVGSSTSVTCTTPIGTAGATTVVVTSNGGTASLTNAFTYTSSLPTITTISPVSGSTGGGTSITVNGTNFASGNTVTLGGVTISCTYSSTTRLNCVTPSGSSGPKDIVVTTASGTGTKLSAFTHQAPTISVASPSSGSVGGGTSITIYGNYFTSGSTITLDGAAISCSVVSPTNANCVTPAGSLGAKNIVVTAGGGSGTLASAFTYQAPTISTITPSAGYLGGGTSIMINGGKFGTANTATIGGAVMACSRISSSQLSCVTPAGSLGPRDVVVTTAGVSVTKVGGFTYASAGLTGVVPNIGPASGGTVITLTGAGFAAGATVTFGGVAATGCSVISSTSMTCTTPPNTAGAKTVAVTSSGSTASLSSAFSYQAGLTSVLPSSGTAAGGTVITLTGSGLAAGASVTVGGVAATGCSVASSTSMTCTTPTGTAGAQAVTVTSNGSTASLPSAFTYQSNPTGLTSVAPSSGSAAGGTVITLTGSGFAAGASVTVGGVAATACSVASSTSMTCTTPAGTAGAQAVTVTSNGSTASLSSAYTYQVGLSGVAPASGSATGGTTLTITGSGFVAGATATIDGVAATGCSVTTSTSMTCTTPAGTAGAKTVAVTSNGSTASLATAFTYQAGLTSVSPSSGTAAGGTVITLTGSGFAAGASVTVGGAAATACSVASSTSMTCTTPTGTAGAQTITVTSNGSTASLASAFTYQIGLTSVSPASGTAAGGTVIALTGSGFAAGASVTVGGVAATACSVSSSTSMTCTTPSNSVGAKDVVVSSATSATLVAAFTYTAASFSFNATISSAAQDYNLKSAAIAAGWNQTVPLLATVTVNSGVTVGASSTGNYAFATGSSFPGGSSLALINNGTIVGAGGAGGNGGDSVSGGVAGGHAIYAQNAISITNNGTIAGGGGGGGGAALTTRTKTINGEPAVYAAGGGGGGGGAGSTSGSAGAAGDATSLGLYDNMLDGNAGQAGTATAGGAGGVAVNNWAVGKAGGAGGALGTVGTNATGSSGGAAGAYAIGNASITWVTAGTRLGGVQ